MKEKLYKNKYCIALYDRDDDLITVCDNVDDLANFLGINLRKARDIVSTRFRNKYSSVCLGESKISLYFINMRKEEESED